VTVDIRDVARACGVSVATVSRALNDRPEVSAVTRSRVVETARRLGYAPNSQARALVRRRSDTVGLIWDTAYVRTRGRQPFLQDLVVAVKLALADTGYHLLLLSPPGTDASPDAFVRVADQHSLDGLLLMGVDEHLPAVDGLIASGRACVGLDLPVSGPRATYVSTDNRGGAMLAAEHLVGLGHRRIATITGPPDQLPSIAREQGFHDAMAASQLPVPPEHVVHGDFFFASGVAAMERLLQLPEPPTAVFAAGDQMAVGALRALESAGRAVPGDVSVVGFDDVEIASMSRPALTTVAQDYLAMGQAAVDLLGRLIDAGDAGRSRRDGPGVAAAASADPPDGTPSADPPDGAGARFPSPELLAARLVVRASTAAPPH